MLLWSQVDAGHVCPLSMTGRRGPRPARRPRARRPVGAAAGVHRLRPRAAPGRRQGRRPGRDGHDREAGRVRPVGHVHRGRAHRRRPARGRRGLPPHRPQVVLLGADERPVPRAGPRRLGHRPADLLRRPARARGRHPQPLAPAAAQGQARQPLERLQRGRARRHLGRAARRRGRRPAHDPADGQRHPAGLRGGVGGHDARRARARRAPRPSPHAPSAACWSTPR